jgi:hypothetical protein
MQAPLSTKIIFNVFSCLLASNIMTLIVGSLVFQCLLVFLLGGNNIKLARQTLQTKLISIICILQLYIHDGLDFSQF